LKALRRPVRREITNEIEIADVTGPLDCIRGKKILVLGDTENLTYSARDLGFKVSFRTLASLLRRTAHSCTLYAFFSRNAGDNRREGYFENRGWTSYANDIKVVRAHDGIRRRANCDNFLLFHAGILVSRSHADVVCIASGDGALASDLANAILSLPKRREIVTLSLAGSTSRQLDAAENADISVNIELGLDCLLPISNSKDSSRFRNGNGIVNPHPNANERSIDHV
jgi:hypothetical protein